MSSRLPSLCVIALLFAESAYAEKPSQEITDWETDMLLIQDDAYETVVVATPPPLSAGTEKKGQTDIDRRHPQTTDDALEMLTGLTIVQHGSEGKGHQLLLRGFDAAHGSDVEVLLQGISLNEPSHVHGQGYLDLYGIIPEVILEMQVAKGPFLPWQGHFANAGTVSFELGVPGSLRPGLVRTEISHRGRLRGVVVAAPKALDKETFVASEAVYDRGFGPDREATRGVFLGQYSHRFSNRDSLNITLSGQMARFESPGAVALAHVEDEKIDFYGAYGPAGQGESDRVLARAGWKSVSGSTDVSVFAYGALRRYSLEENFTGWLQYESEGDRKRQRQTGGLAGADAQIAQTLPLPFSSRLHGGLGCRVDAMSQDESQVYENGTPWLDNRNLELNLISAHAFVGWRLLPWRWLELFPSVRADFVFYDAEDNLLDKTGDEARLALSPRIAVALPVHPLISLFADYGRGVRPPEARAVIAPRGTGEDESLSRYEGGEPEFSSTDAVEAGLSAEPWHILKAKLVGFAYWTDHEMVFDHVSNMNIEQNGTQRLGVELNAQLTPLSWIRLETSGTWVDAQFRRSGHPVPGAPRWLVTGGLDLGEEKGPKGGANLLWLGERALAHGATQEGYIKLDLYAGFRAKHFEITLVADNVLAREIMEGAYHYASWFKDYESQTAIPKIHFVAGEPFTVRLMLTAYL